MRLTWRKVHFHVLDWGMFSLGPWPVPPWRGCCKLSFTLCLIPMRERPRPGGTCLWSQISWVCGGRIASWGQSGQLSKISSPKKIETRRELKWCSVGDHVPSMWEASGSSLGATKKRSNSNQNKNKEKEKAFLAYISGNIILKLGTLAEAAHCCVLLQLQGALFWPFWAPSLTCSYIYT